MADTDSVWVFTDDDVTMPGPDGRPITVRGRRSATAHRIPLDDLAKNVDQFMDGAEVLLRSGTRHSGAFGLDTVEVHAKIGADGKVGFLGTGAGVAAEASVTFTFTRNREDDRGATRT